MTIPIDCKVDELQALGSGLVWSDKGLLLAATEAPGLAFLQVASSAPRQVIAGIAGSQFWYASHARHAIVPVRIRPGQDVPAVGRLCRTVEWLAEVPPPIWAYERSIIGKPQLGIDLALHILRQGEVLK